MNKQGTFLNTASGTETVIVDTGALSPTSIPWCNLPVSQFATEINSNSILDQMMKGAIVFVGDSNCYPYDPSIIGTKPEET